MLFIFGINRDFYMVKKIKEALFMFSTKTVFLVLFQAVMNMQKNMKIYPNKKLSKAKVIIFMLRKT